MPRPASICPLRLTNGLASENERWGDEVERLQTR